MSNTCQINAGLKRPTWRDILYYSEPAMKGGGDQELQAQADSTGWNIKSKAPEGVEA